MAYGSLLGMAVLFGAPVSETPATILGDWSRGDGIAKVRIAPCGTNLCATNTWVKPGIKDEKVGDVLILTVSAHHSQLWRGHAYDPQRNLHLKIEIKLSHDAMTSRGCVLGGLICKQAKWRRI